MQITLTKEQVREAFGELRYMGADYCVVVKHFCNTYG